MTMPSVMIVAKCPNGHETLMYPEKCLSAFWNSEKGNVIYAEWDCPVCPKDSYQYEVRICKT